MPLGIMQINWFEGWSSGQWRAQFSVVDCFTILTKLLVTNKAAQQDTYQPLFIREDMQERG